MRHEPQGSANPRRRLLGKDGCKGKDVGSTKKEQGEKGRLLVGYRRVGAVGERGRGGAGGGGQYNVGVLTDGTITSSRALFSRSQVSPN